MRALAWCSVALLLAGFLGCAPHSSLYVNSRAWTKEGAIHAESEGSGADYDSAELLASMNAVSQIGEQIKASENAIIARPDFRVYVLQIVQTEPFYRVRVQAVILAP